MVNSAKEAREIIKEHEDHTQQLATGECFNRKCMVSKGYLVALEGPEVKAKNSALAFFASVIKSGEPWTQECQAAYDKAVKP